MIEMIQITFSSGSIDDARKVCRYLVQERLVASAKIIPWVETITMLDNQLDTDQESRVYLIARKDKLDTLLSIIKKNTTYQVPEVIWTPLLGANSEYHEWIEQAIGSSK